MISPVEKALSYVYYKTGRRKGRILGKKEGVQKTKSDRRISYFSYRGGSYCNIVNGLFDKSGVAVAIDNIHDKFNRAFGISAHVLVDFAGLSRCGILCIKQKIKKNVFWILIRFAGDQPGAYLVGRGGWKAMQSKSYLIKI